MAMLRREAAPPRQRLRPAAWRRLRAATRVAAAVLCLQVLAAHLGGFNGSWRGAGAEAAAAAARGVVGGLAATIPSASALPATAAAGAAPDAKAAGGAAAIGSEGEGVSGGGALRAELLRKVQPRIARWEKTAGSGRSIFGFGGQATKLLNQSIAQFDSRAEAGWGAVAVERDMLDKELRRQLNEIFLMQQASIEEALFQRLKRDLLRKMWRKKGELAVKVKLKLLHAAMNDYDKQVVELMPAFVGDSERGRAEKRLSEMQWGILDTPEGKEMQQKWKVDKMRRSPTRQSRGISVSLSPGMRLMLRPSGLGNFQISSRRSVGPPHNPNEVSIGVLNDGNVIDVYNNKPRPPLIKFQPSVGIDLSFG